MVRQMIRIALIVLIGFAAPAASPAQTPIFDTPEKLWRDFNPETPALEIESLKTWREEGAAFEKLRFTAERCAEGKVRVFAIRGAPETGSRLPGILHIHGGGQTASIEWVRFWVKRGYVCTTYDFTGPWAGRTEVTDWGPIRQGNLAEAKGGLLVRPSPKQSSWYHWTIVARRALTLLASHPRVDRDRLGVFGVSIGGTLCWLVAGTDDRVKTAVPIYGCGYNYDRRRTVWGFPELDSDLLLFQKTLAPESYAPSITRPVLLLDATNDFHGWMDNAYEILAATRGPWRLAMTPRYNHHIDPSPGADLPAWMDWQLRGGAPFPPAPKLELRLDSDGVPVARVRPDGAKGITKVEFFYSLGEKPPPNRFWRRAPIARPAGQAGVGLSGGASAALGKSAGAKSPGGNGTWKARLPVLQTSDPVRAFANVTYASNVCLSTNLLRGIPDRLGTARSTLAWSARPPAEEVPGGPFVYGAAHTDPNMAKDYFTVDARAADRDVVQVNPGVLGARSKFTIVSHYLGDPGLAGRKGMPLAFEYQGAYFPQDQPRSIPGQKAPDFDPTGLTVSVTEHEWTPKARKYSATVDATRQPSSGWRRASLAPADFRDAEGKPLESWRDVDKIELRGNTTKDDPPRFSRFHWVVE